MADLWLGYSKRLGLNLWNEIFSMIVDVCDRIFAAGQAYQLVQMMGTFILQT